MPLAGMPAVLRADARKEQPRSAVTKDWKRIKEIIEAAQRGRGISQKVKNTGQGVNSLCCEEFPKGVRT